MNKKEALGRDREANKWLKARPVRVLFQISWALAEVKVRMGENTRD